MTLRPGHPAWKTPALPLTLFTLFLVPCGASSQTSNLALAVKLELQSPSPGVPDSILQQVASWQTLLPGQFPTTRATLNAAMVPPTAVSLGTYTISASYIPPYLMPSKKAELTLRRIDIPKAQLSSSAPTYTVPAQARR